jgi:tetratricopeptide (TPR) repeat protein
VKGYPSFFLMPPGSLEGIRCSLFRRGEADARSEPLSVEELQKEIDGETRRNAHSQVEAGFQMKQAGNLAGAALAFDRAILAAPQDPEAWLHRGILRAAQQRLPEALADYAQVAALRTDGKAHDHAVHALLRARRFDAAAACASDWLEREPDSLRALRQRARAHWGRGDRPRAREDKARACALGDQESCGSRSAGD